MTKCKLKCNEGQLCCPVVSPFQGRFACLLFCDRKCTFPSSHSSTDTYIFTEKMNNAFVHFTFYTHKHGHTHTHTHTHTQTRTHTHTNGAYLLEQACGVLTDLHEAHDDVV